MKIYYHGRELKQKRKSNGQFKKNRGFFRITAAAIFVIGATIAIFNPFFMEWVNNETSAMHLDETDTMAVDVSAMVEAPKDVIVDMFVPEPTMEEKLEELKDEVRNKIMKIESGSIVTDTGEMFATFDPPRSKYEKCRRIGGKMDLECLSFGPLQFKIPTIIYYEKKINDRDVTEKEAFEIAHDLEEASRLFDDIIYNEEGGIWNWSAAKDDPEYYTNVIPIIRKLME